MNLNNMKPEAKRALAMQLLEDEDVLQPEMAADPKLIRLPALQVDAANRKEQKMLSTGFRSLNILTKNLAPGELIILFGNTSHGKSQLMQNIAYRVANFNHPVLVITLEMSKVETYHRLQTIANIPEEDFVKLPILFPEQNEVRAADVDPLVKQAKAAGAELVCVDHLHYFSRSVDNATSEIGRLVNMFKRVAVKYDIPLILISHIVKLKTDKEPGMEHLRDSSFIYQDADIVMSVWRDMDSIKPEVKVRIHKNRNRGFDAGNNHTRLLIEDGVRLTDAIV